MEMIPDFVEQILVDSESAEQEQKYELDLEQADYLLMAIVRLENKMSDVNSTADRELLMINEWRNKELTRLDKKRSWLTWNLEQFIRQFGEKTIRLPHGDLKLRKGRDRAVIVDEAIFLPVGKKLNLLRTVPESTTPDLRAVIEWIKKTGDIPDGVEFIPAEVSFKYSINNGEQEDEDN